MQMATALVDANHDTLSLVDFSGRKLAELKLHFGVDGKAWRVSRLQEIPGGWRGVTEDPEVTVQIIREQTYLRIELCGPFGPAADVTYFSGSMISASHVHAFIPDDHCGTFSVRNDRTFTITNQAAMRERLGLTEQLWMIAPQPHVFGLGTPDGRGFSFSIPECLPVDAVQFVMEERHLRIDFRHYVATGEGARLPRVYLDLGVGSRNEMLDRHLAHARELGLVVANKPHVDWWHNPLYCTWGDQCRLSGEGISKNESLTRERLLGWAQKIRTFYDGEVNFIIDDGYFVGMGDFRLRPELYPTVDDFRELIAELKRRRFRVILWYTPFWLEAHGAAVAEHPEWILHRPDGTLLDETGDWKGKFHFDWSHPGLRGHQRNLIRHFLVDLDADGFKIDMTYAHPPTRDIAPHDPTWAAGNQFCKRVLEFIYAEATSIKPDVFLTINGVEPYLQPFTSAIRLNDLFNLTDATKWYERAELTARLMPGVAIDVDGWPAALEKIREYPFVASVYGAPVTYYLDGTEVGDQAFGPAEINRMASVWAVYASAPIQAGDQFTFDLANARFERRDAAGKLRALSLAKRAFIVYGQTICLTVNESMAVAVPLENEWQPSRCRRVNRDGSSAEVPLHLEQGRALLHAEDSANGVLYYELI